MECLNNVWKNRILKIKSTLLELEKCFKELKKKELNNRATKFRKETEELFFKTINISIDDKDNIEGKEKMKKRPFAKSTWYN